MLLTAEDYNDRTTDTETSMLTCQDKYFKELEPVLSGTKSHATTPFSPKSKLSVSVPVQAKEEDRQPVPLRAQPADSTPERASELASRSSSDDSLARGASARPPSVSSTSMASLLPKSADLNRVRVASLTGAKSNFESEPAAPSRVSYLRDPKNAPKILGASAVSVVASYMLGREIKSNVDTTQQLSENAARMNAQQQEATNRALAEQAQALFRSPSMTAALYSEGADHAQKLFRVQKRDYVTQTNGIAKRGTPNPAGLFVAGVLGFTFYKGASAIEEQRAHDRAIIMREKQYLASSANGNRERKEGRARADWE